MAKSLLGLGLTLAAMLAVDAAQASFHTFAIETIYSNADGTVQFVVLRETQGFPGENAWSGHSFTSTHAGTTKTFPFTTDLPSNRTGGKAVLLATQGFAALTLIAPDYVIPNGFLATDGGTLNYAGVDQVTYGPLPTDGAGAITRTGTAAPNIATNFAGATAVIPPLPDVAIEFYNAGLDHYFISDLQPDIDALDSGHFAGWSRTTKSFKVFASQASGGPGVNPVCRFYIPPQHGNSHFFSASPAECAAVLAAIQTNPAYSGYVYETPSAFYIALPNTTTGVCPGATIPVYRLWNQRADSNHRYTTDPVIKAQMIALGYFAEGYGPNQVSMCAPTPGTATVKFVSGSSAPNGTLVSDGASVATANYQGYATPSDAVNVGARSGAGEAITFSEHRPVALQPVTWTTASGDQLVSVPFAGEMDTPVTIWVVAGPYVTTQQTALTLWQTAQQIYWDERLGVHLSLEVVDATANPKASTWSAFTCGAGNANVSAIQTDIGVRPGRMNVYMVNLVDGSTSHGNACVVGGGFVAIASGSGADLLAHELGHDFGLEHIDDLIVTFDMTNVMHSASNVRQFLTEGQTFRAHLRPNSAINAVYSLRPGLPTRACDRDTMALGCPAISKRIWADGGTWPAN